MVWGSPGNIIGNEAIPGMRVSIYVLCVQFWDNFVPICKMIYSHDAFEYIQRQTFCDVSKEIPDTSSS